MTNPLTMNLLLSYVKHSIQTLKQNTAECKVLGEKRETIF